MIMSCAAFAPNVVSANSRVTPLYLACHSASVFFVRELLAHGADSNFTRKSNLAANIGAAAAAAAAVGGVGVGAAFSDNCFIWACHSGELDIVDMMLNAGAVFNHAIIRSKDSTDAVDNNNNNNTIDAGSGGGGGTAVARKTSKSKRKRGPVGYRKYLEFSALLFAAFMGDFDIVKRLLDSNGQLDLGVQGPHGETLEQVLFRIHGVTVDKCVQLARKVTHGPRKLVVNPTTSIAASASIAADSSAAETDMYNNEEASSTDLSLIHI